MNEPLLPRVREMFCGYGDIPSKLSLHTLLDTPSMKVKPYEWSVITVTLWVQASCFVFVDYDVFYQWLTIKYVSSCETDSGLYSSLNLL